jgi:hypothetical protein
MSFTILANSIIIARLVFNRFFSIRGFNMADWAILVTLLIKIGSDTVNYLGIYKHGLGKDIWTFTPDEVTEYAFYVWIGVQCYVIMMTFVKVVLTLFLLSLFSGCRLRRLLWATIVVHVLAGITFSLLGVFTCTPVDYYWTRYSTASKGHCINRLASYMSNGAFTVASDIWLLAIPMTQLYKLKLQWKKKINAGIMFLLGFMYVSAPNTASTSFPHSKTRTEGQEHEADFYHVGGLSSPLFDFEPFQDALPPSTRPATKPSKACSQNSRSMSV